MAAATLASPGLTEHNDRERPNLSPTSSHPPSSFDVSKVPNGHNYGSGSLYSSPNASNVANLLNARPAYDRSTSQLGRYDSKRSSVISNSSFQTAPNVPGSAYGGGSNYGGGSIYGTADGGSSRESLDTVQGGEQSTSPIPPPAPMVNGTGNAGQRSSNKEGTSRPTTANSITSFKSNSTHPGNDLPAQMVTAPSPLDIEVTNLRVARAASPPLPGNPPSQEHRDALLATAPAPKQGIILPETTTFSSSPSHSPSVAAGEHDGLHAVMRRHSESTADSQPNAGEIIPRDFGSEPDPTSDLTAPNNDNASQASTAQPVGQSYPDQQLLHPSSAASITAPPSSSIITNAVRSTRPQRRNTTGSTSMASKSKSTAASGPVGVANTTAGGLVGAAGVATAVLKDEWDMELDEDMRKQAEQIRRERKRREVEAQEEERIERERGVKRDSKGKEKGHARSGSAGGRSVGARSTGGKSLDEWKPVVGNVVGEGHVNYILMYNMLTGIRVAVSRCQAKAPRPLTDADYTAAHKYNFDVIGNELTPSAKYDFKFKDYAPWVFRSLREDSFNIDPADYLLSLTSKYILSELGSPGKSGSFFYYSRDYRFIIKTIRAAEHKWLRRVLKDYYRHVRDNPHTLISRFYGLHRVKLPHGNKIHFVIMNNLFPAHRDIHETYDLKGSTVGRRLAQSKLDENPGAVMKDLNWIERGRVLELGPYKRALLTEQLRRDVDFLKSIGVMDYSLLVGLHSVKRGNKENIRGNTLKVFKPDIKDVPDLDAPIGARKWIGIKQAMEVRRAILMAQRQHQTTIGTSSSVDHPSSSAPQPHRRASFSSKADRERGLVRQGTSRERGGAKDRSHSKQSPLHTLESSNLPEEDPLPSDRSGFIFYSDDGGYKATDDLDGEWHGGLGGRLVIDGRILSDDEALEKGKGKGETDGEGVVYYLGVIDILTRWTFVKRMEHFWKGLKADRHKISPVNPIEYGDRFFSFMQAIIRGGEGGDRFV